jgi:outer membrane protein TolC
MKKKICQIFILLLIPATALPQKLLTLKECYDLAMSANAISGEKDVHNEIWSARDRNISKGWLPLIDANASAVYQSDVVEMGTALASVPIPGLADAFPVMPHDQYKLSLDINQMIYDGGAIKGARKAEQAELLVNLKQTEVDLYKYRSQVNSFYFSILLQERQRELLGNYLELLNKRIATLSSAADNGVILRSDIDVLTSEKLKIEQQANEALIRKEALLIALSQITGTSLDPSVTLVLPEVPSRLEDSLQRPEIELFDLRKKQLDAGLEITKSKRMPKIFGYASFGYGSPPGQNFFEEDFGTYYMVGGGIKWNIFDWNKTRNEKEVISLQQNLVEGRKRDLSDNLKRQLELKDAEIRSLSSLTESDARIIEIRKRISATAESQYSNGTITATDYLNEINSERQAIVNSEIHKIGLAMARVEYLNISGTDLK